MKALKQLLVVVLFLLTSAVVVYSAEYDMGLDDNLIANPGFETENPDKPGQPADWGFHRSNILEGGIYWVDDIVKSGKRAVKLDARKYATPSGSNTLTSLCFINVMSKRFMAPAAQSTLQASAWLKAQDVKKGPGSWYKLRFTISALDEKGAKIKHWDIASTEGTFDWKKYQGTIIVPEGAKWITASVGMTACTGTAWVDDVEIKVVGNPLNKSAIMQKAKALSGPIVIPHPWKMQCGKDRIELTELSVIVPEKDDIFKNALSKWLKEEGIPHNFALPGKDINISNGLVYVGDSSVKEIADCRARCYPGSTWQDLGDEGYFLSIMRKDGKPVIYIGANSEQGRFYALQSLKQLLVRHDNQLLLAEANILDKPVFSRRGIAIGPQWFDNKERAIERLANLKCNYIWIHGAFWDNIFGGNNSRQHNWRKPLNDNHRKVLAEYLKICRNNFITPTIAIFPRGIPLIQYSSDTDINLVVGKMSDLYNIGFRNFGLSFDDLQNIGQERLIVQADIEKFGNDMGKAHLYFVSEVYKRLKKQHSDINFGIVPLVYGGFITLPEESSDFRQKSYLRHLSALPQEIEFISCPYGIENIREVTELTKRPPLVWDNFFCAWERGKAPVFIPPFRWTKGLQSMDIKGYIINPIMPSLEDAAGTSWITAADYFWNADRQSQDASYQAAIVRAVGGVENLDSLKDYTDFTSKLNDYTIPGKSKEEQYLYLQNSITELQKWQKKLIPAMPKNLSRAIDEEISTYLTNLGLIKNDLSAKPFPIKVKRLSGAIKIDGLLDEAAWGNADSMTGFMLIGGKPARQQTEFRLCYDDQNLYAGITCLEPLPGSIVARHKVRDKNIWEDDCIEFFLSPAGNTSYYHIVVNTIGTIYDAIVSDPKWNGNYKAATKIGADSWTLEIAIPFKELGLVNIKPASRWNFNICRERYAEKPIEISSYALLLKGGFHNPSRFRVLEFQ
jgi:hypothetical protein